MGRERENDRLPPKALAVFIIMVIVELDFLRGPRPVMRAAGQDGWLAVLIAGAAMAVSVWLILSLMQRFPDMSLVEIAQRVLGRPLGMLLVLVYVGFWLAHAGILLQLQSHIFGRQLLPGTPETALSLYMLLLSAYLIRHGLEPMGRLFLILLSAYLLPMVLLIGLAALGEVDLGALQPFLERGPAALLEGAWLSYAAAAGPAVLLMMGPYLTHFRGAQVAALAGLGLVFLPKSLLFVMLVVQLGPTGTTEHVWPTLALMEIVEIPAFTGFRLDPIFITIWALLVFGTIALSQYAAAAAVRRLVGLRTNFWPVWLSTALLAGLLILAPANPADLLRWVEALGPYLTPAVTFVVPLLLLVIAHLRGMEQPGRKETEA